MASTQKTHGEGKRNAKRAGVATPTMNKIWADVDGKKEQLTEAWKNGQEYSTDGLELLMKPFKVCSVNGLIAEEAFLSRLQQELNDHIFYQKNNDLYQFHQTDDFKKLKSPYSIAIRKFMQTTVHSWLQQVTGVQLSSRVDITCSRYDHTDVLLCHDDELDSRRFAFVFYLTSPWKKEDGGLLDLFDMDEHLQPRQVVHSIVPAWNKFVFFEVTEASHHQVSEVMTETKTRLSVNGWFHSSHVIPRAPRYIESKPCTSPAVFIEKAKFLNWINPIYVNPKVQKQIQAKFEENSEIQLQAFLTDSMYDTLVKALQSCPENSWCLRGPPNKRCYSSLDLRSAPDVVQEFVRFMQSEAMFLILAQLTGLGLHALAQGEEERLHLEDASTSEEKVPSASSVGELASSCDKPSTSHTQTDHKDLCKKPRLHQNEAGCCGEVRRWQPGNYTLIHDTDHSNQDIALLARFTCHCKDWKSEYGGLTSFIAKDEDEELLTVVPCPNSLALVYKDTDTLGFVKYVNSKARELAVEQQTFFDGSFVYNEYS